MRPMFKLIRIIAAIFYRGFLNPPVPFAFWEKRFFYQIFCAICILFAADPCHLLWPFTRIEVILVGLVALRTVWRDWMFRAKDCGTMEKKKGERR